MQGVWAHLSGARAAFSCRLLVLLVAAALCFPAQAEDGKSLKGVALVIGQSAYQHITPLPNPANDARDMVKLLTDMGFDARGVSDRDSKKLKRDLERFAEDAEGADVAFLYYSGHGIESGGENWLVPVDADVSSLDDASETLVPVSALIDQLKQTVPVVIVLLDACRTNPFPADARIRVTPSGSAEPIGEGGLMPVRGAKAIANAPAATETLGTVIGFAAEPGRPALDGPSGQNSPYAAALLRHLSAMKGEEFGTVMRMVTEEVYLDTKAKQRPWTNESLRRLLYFGVAPPDPQGDDGIITGERRKLLLTISALPDVNRAQVLVSAEKDKVPLDALFGVLKAMGTDKIPEDPGELQKVLDSQADRLRQMLAQSNALTTDDPQIAQLTASADKAIRQGAIVAARGFLDKAVARMEESSGDVDAVEEALKKKRLAEAALYVQRADASALAFDYVAAAADYAKASQLAEKWDAKLSRQYKLQEGLAYSHDGFETGNADIFQQAINALNQAMDSGDAEIRRANRPIVLNNLALIYQSLGERQIGAENLQKAADMLNEAIALSAAAQDFDAWAKAQQNLGNVLLKLSEREREPRLINDAVAAYRAALSKQDRATAPLDWAGIQNNIGIALYTLADREQDGKSLDAAEAAYNAALEIYTRETTPVEWAMVKSNLGNTLGTIGFQRNQPERLKQAEQVLRQSLEVRTRDHFPLSWASSRMNLGIVLTNSTRYETGTARLNEAVDCFNDTLAVYKRKNFPLDWATAQNNLGSAYQTLAQRSGDVSKMEASASAFRAARQVYTRRDFPLDWAMTQFNLGNTLSLLAAMTQNQSYYEQAADSYRDSLKEYTRAVMPRQWAQVQDGLASSLHWLSAKTGSADTLRQSIEARRAALEVLTVDNAPVDWANAQNGLGMSLLNLGTMESSTEYLDESQKAFEASLQVFTREAQPLHWAFGRNNIGDVHWNRATFAKGGKPELEAALACFEEAKAGFREAGNPAPIALVDQKINMVGQQMAQAK